MLCCKRLRGRLGRVLAPGGSECKDEGWLGEAIRRNFSLGVKKMLDEGADPNKELGGATPLGIAAATRLGFAVGFHCTLKFP